MPHAGLGMMGSCLTPSLGSRAGSEHWVTSPSSVLFLPGYTAFEATMVALLTQDKAPGVEMGLGMNLGVRTNLGTCPSCEALSPP